MKRAIIAAIAFLSITTAGLAQTSPAVKKNEPAKTQVAKKSKDEKATAAATTEKKEGMGHHKKAKAHKKHNSK